jgi:PAS domain S-box-containing protein
MIPDGGPPGGPGPLPQPAQPLSLRQVQARILGGTLLAFGVVLAIGVLALRTAFRRIEEDSVRQRVTRTRLHLQQQGENRRAIIREYAWWTDTWTFIDAPTTAKSREFLKTNFIDWIPLHYGDQLIAFWSLDRRRVLIWTDSSARRLAEAFERPERFRFIDSTKSAGGLVLTPGGLYLAAFSVVVQTADQTGTGPWHGYMALARPVDPALMAEWSAEQQERLALHAMTADPARIPAEPVTRRIAGGDSVESRFLVNDLFGDPVAVATVTGSRAFIARLQYWIIALFVLAAAVSLGVVAAVLRLGHGRVVRPLAGVSDSLRRMRADGALTPLDVRGGVREWTEFVTAFNDTLTALGASEARYQTLFRQAADAQFVYEGPARFIVDANPAAERLVGRAHDEVVGRSLDEFFASTSGEAGAPLTMRALRPGEPGPLVEMAVAEVRVGERRLSIASVRDLSEREAIEAQLRQAQKMEVLGRLSGGIAHDFNNLLGAVLVSASSLREELAAGHPAQDAVQTIERAARRAADLTRQLLSFSRRGGLRREPVAVHGLMAGVVQLVERTFGHAVRVTVESYAPDDATVLADVGQLEQALLNLSLNARDAMPDGGTLTLRSSVEVVDETNAARIAGLASGRWVVLSVADTGVGMSADVLAHLFEPFFTTKALGKGTGLGLANTYGIVRSHGGVIDVQSEPGRGSRFDVYLPLGAAASRRPRPDADAPLGGTETILLVDDEDDLRRALRRGLERLGYKVIEARDGLEAVARLAERPDDIQLVMLDVLMPRMGGVQAFTEIRARWPATPVLAMSGRASGEEMQRLVAGGVQGVMEKPFSMADLAKAVRDVLEPAAPAPAGG